MKKLIRSHWPRIVLTLVLLLALLGVVFLWGNLALRRRLPIRYEAQVEAAAEQWQIDKYLLYAVIKCESNFNADAVSPKGAVGLMQLRPSTADWLGEKFGLPVDDLTDPENNIRLGTCYLRYLLDKFEVPETALAAYNGGEGNVRSWLGDPEHSSDGKTLTDIPFPETAKYVNRVTTRYALYQKLYS